MTLDADTFLARFVQHVLPPGFVKIRHFGLMAPRHATTTLERARRLVDGAPESSPSNVAPAPAPAADWRALLRELTGVDLRRCPTCDALAVVRHPLPMHARAPPEAA